MAAGDVVSDNQSIATSANLDFQPAAGVEVLITEYWGDTNTTLRAYDGTRNQIVRTGVRTGATATPLKFFINNTDRLRLNNNSGSTVDIGYTGVQTK